MGSRWIRPHQVFYRSENSPCYEHNRIGGRFVNRPPGLVGTVKLLVSSIENVVTYAIESLWRLGHFNRGLRPILNDDIYGRQHPPHSGMSRL